MASAFDKNAAYAVHVLRQALGFTAPQASGFVGNFGAESGLEPGRQEGSRSGTVTPILDKYGRSPGGGIDLPQWTGSRRYAFAKFVSANNLPYPNIDTSLKFVIHELKTTHQRAARQVRKTATARAAAETAEAYFEMAGIKNMGSRIAFANRALQLYLASPYAQQPAPSPAPAPSPQPTPVNPMPAPTPAPLPDSKPWWQSKTVITNIATLLASTPLFAKYLGGMDVSSLTETLSTVAVLLGPIISSVFRAVASQPVTGSPLARAVDEAREQQDAAVQAPQAVPEAWRYEEPLTIQQATDHQDVIRQVKGLSWPEFLQLAVKLTPMLLVAKESAQKIVEQNPAPTPAPTTDPLDILRTQP